MSWPEGTMNVRTRRRARVDRGYVRWRYDGEGGDDSDSTNIKGSVEIWRLYHIMTLRKGYIGEAKLRWNVPAYMEHVLHDPRLKFFKVVQKYDKFRRRLYKMKRKNYRGWLFSFGKYWHTIRHLDGIIPCLQKCDVITGQCSCWPPFLWLLQQSKPHWSMQ